MKPWVYLAILVAALGGLKYFHHQVYTAGYNAAIVVQEKAVQDAREAATAEARVKWQKLVDEAQATIVTEEKIVEKIREVEIPVVVERIVTNTPDCAAIPELAGVFNQQVSASRGGETGSTDIPAEPD